MSSRSGSRPPRPAAPSADVAGAPSWIEPTPGGAVLRIHVQPGAARTRIAGTHGAALKVQVHARPVDGAANRELVAVVAAALAVRPAAVSILSGTQGREKRLRVEGVDAARVTARLAAFVDKAPGAD